MAHRYSEQYYAVSERWLMSTTGLDVFDTTLQTTNLWLKEIAEDIGPDRRRALAGGA